MLRYGVGVCDDKVPSPFFLPSEANTSDWPGSLTLLGLQPPFWRPTTQILSSSCPQRDHNS